MKINWKRLMQLDKLLKNKKNLQKFKNFNKRKLNAFFLSKFLKGEKYKQYLKINNKLNRFILIDNYIKYFNLVYSYIMKILKNKLFFLKRSRYEVKYFLSWYKKVIINNIIIIILKKYKSFLKFKFRFKKLKKVKYLQLYKYNKKSKKFEITEENLYSWKRSRFLKKLTKYKHILRLKAYYVRFRYSKYSKKKIKYISKKKSFRYIRSRLYYHLFFKKIFKKRGKKRKKWKLLYTEPRIKGLIGSDSQILNFLKENWYLFSRRKKSFLKYFFKLRKKRFFSKLNLIKKYKRKSFKLRYNRKRRTGILHFRSYYSNYYITLTDLSFRVICSCSAGSLNDGNNKKTKMSTVVVPLMFYRINHFLRKHKIRQLKLVCTARNDKTFKDILKFIKNYRYKIKTISYVQKVSHHLGQRKQKPRRI